MKTLNQIMHKLQKLIECVLKGQHQEGIMGIGTKTPAENGKDNMYAH